MKAAENLHKSNQDLMDKFLQTMEGILPSRKPQHILKAHQLETPLGPMVAIGDEVALYLLEFPDQKHSERAMKHLQEKTKSIIQPGLTESIRKIKEELAQYFEGKLREFKTPLFPLGSPFQKKVWEELKKIPYGETRSYGETARNIKKPTAFRAVANANGANRFAIVIPCHRVINTNGGLGGYGGGIDRKTWLLDHERKFMC
jgi:AraC family transcriptional regulator of adaptative response/methylated-DNA-[protein]-cysteine methyltransferase